MLRNERCIELYSGEQWNKLHVPGVKGQFKTAWKMGEKIEFQQAHVNAISEVYKGGRNSRKSEESALKPRGP